MCIGPRPLLPSPMCNHCESRCFNVLAHTNATDFSLQLSAMDVSARTTMKGAAKCDKHCDLQNSVNQQGFERILRFRDIPESMPASESTSVSCARRASQPPVVELCVSGVRFCAPRCLLLLLMHEVLVAAFGKQLTEHRSVPCLLLRCWWP